jgi:hypothetical protein
VATETNRKSLEQRGSTLCCGRGIYFSALFKSDTGEQKEEGGRLSGNRNKRERMGGGRGGCGVFLVWMTKGGVWWLRLLAG